MNNKEQLDALMTALYDATATPEKTAKLVAATAPTDTQAQEKFQKPAADLNENQKAFFTIQMFKAHAKGLVMQRAEKEAQAQIQQARRAARQAAEGAASGF